MKNLKNFHFFLFPFLFLFLLGKIIIYIHYFQAYSNYSLNLSHLLLFALLNYFDHIVNLHSLQLSISFTIILLKYLSHPSIFKSIVPLTLDATLLLIAKPFQYIHEFFARVGFLIRLKVSRQ